MLEKVLATQLTRVFNQQNIFDKFQAGFRRYHSSETALVRVSNHILIQYITRKCSVLLMLDLTSVFQTVEHLALVNMGLGLGWCERQGLRMTILLPCRQKSLPSLLSRA